MQTRIVSLWQMWEWPIPMWTALQAAIQANSKLSDAVIDTFNATFDPVANGNNLPADRTFRNVGRVCRNKLTTDLVSNHKTNKCFVSASAVTIAPKLFRFTSCYTRFTNKKLVLCIHYRPTRIILCCTWNIIQIINSIITPIITHAKSVTEESQTRKILTFKTIYVLLNWLKIIIIITSHHIETAPIFYAIMLNADIIIRIPQSDIERPLRHL